MKILRLVYEWPPPWIGLTPAPFELTKAQAKLGNSIDVFCGRWPKTGAVVKIDGVNVTSFFREPLRGTMLLTVAPVVTLYFMFWRVFNRVDVYHVHGHFGLYFYLYKLVFGFLDKTPVVSHYHICAKARWEEAKSSNKKISLISSLIDWPLAVMSDQLAIRVADHYVFVGEKVKNDVIKYCSADADKCTVVESGVNPELFNVPSAKEKEVLKIKNGFSSTDVVICNLGFLVERKNIHLILESLAFLPNNYKLMLVGKVAEAYRNVLISIIEKHHLAERVKFFGEIDYPDVPNYYKSADVFCLPSSYEALSCGVPTVASGFKIPELKGLIELTEFRAEKLAENIKMAFQLVNEVESEKVRAEYSWGHRAETLGQIYTKIMERGK